ncbi:MAG: 30S ribosomal protein S15 [Phycisphaerae bacterium]|nr:30S ribosomal protein S15 [Phycisphaerae bacterium]
MPTSTLAKTTTIAANRRHEHDTGSPQVQIALLTQRINTLQAHFKTNRKDHAGRRGLLLLVGQRNRLLRYLARVDRTGYTDLIKKLGLRK